MGESWTERVTRTAGAVVRRLKPEGVERTFGVTYDGSRLWLVDGATGHLVSMDPETGAVREEMPTVHADAGIAHDGRHLWTIAKAELLKVDPESGAVLARVPLDGEDYSGLAWAEGALWAGRFRGKGVVKIDPETGRVLKRLRSDRLVTGITWRSGELWHGSEEARDAQEGTELRRLDPESGEVFEVVELPPGAPCSGLAADQEGRFFCGDSRTGEVRAVERQGA